MTTYIDRGAVEKYVSSLPWVQHWAMITHDRDVSEDNTPKEVHSHILLYTYSAKTSSGVRKNFDNFSNEYYQNIGGEPQNTMCQVMHDSASQWRYLIHADNPEKAQYSYTERICDNAEYWRKLERTQGMTDSDDNAGLQMVQDMLGGVSSMEMIERYGKEYIYHAKAFKEVCRDVIREEHDCQFDGKSYFKISEMLPFMLADCPYDKATVNAFYIVLQYLQNQCHTSFESRLDFCLDHRIDINTGELKEFTKI